MNFDFDIIAGLLNPAPIYKGIGAGSMALSTTVFFMFVVVAMIRYFQESVGGLRGSANMGKAITELLSSYVLTIIYGIAGGLILVLIATLTEYFASFGAFSIVANKFGQIMLAAKENQPSPQDNFVLYLLDFSAVGAVPASWMFYKAASILFALTHMILRIGYAIYFSVIFLVGFFILPTAGLAGVLNLSNGWTKNVLGLALWPLMESLFFFLVLILLRGIDDDIISAASVGGFSGFAVLHWSMGALFILMIFGLFLSLIFSLKLLQNSEMLSGIALPAAAIVNRVSHEFKSGAGKVAKNMSPTSGGGRLRDKMLDTLSNVNKSPVKSTKSAVKSTKSAVGKLSKKFKKE